jgi:hypothetical protein
VAKRIAPLAALWGAVFVLYARALGRGFTSEDFLLVRFLGEHPPWRHLLSQLASPWLGIAAVRFYRPVSTLLYGLEIAAFGAHPFGYDLVHLLLHAVNAALVYAIVRRLPGAAPPWVPLAAAALFALHPLHPNAVLFGASFATLFGAAFLLGAFLAYQRCRILLSSIFFALALGSYEAAAVLPFLLAAHDLLLGPRDEARRREPRHLPAWLPFFALLGLYLLLRRAIFGVFLGGYEEYGARLLAPYWGALVHDLATALYVLHLPLYARWPGAGALALAGAALVALPLGLFLPARRAGSNGTFRLWLFGWAWAVAALAPFAFRPPVPGNGRYAYLAAIGVALALTALAGALSDALPAGWRRLPVVGLALLGLGWVSLLARTVGTYQEAAQTARAIQGELVRIDREGGAGPRLFLAGHPDFLSNRAGMPVAPVFHYGLADSVHPPFARAALAVYPLPSLAGLELLPVGLAAPRDVYLWDARSRRVSEAVLAPAPVGRKELEVLAPADGAALAPARPEVAFEAPAGLRYRLVVLAPGNPAVVDLGARAGTARAALPAAFLVTMDRLYGGEFYWWIEARDAAGNVAGWSRMRRFRLAR